MDAKTVRDIVANPKEQNCHPISGIGAWNDDVENGTVVDTVEVQAGQKVVITSNNTST